jgi:hypothetical protein
MMVEFRFLSKSAMVCAGTAFANYSPPAIFLVGGIDHGWRAERYKGRRHRLGLEKDGRVDE